ncbi:DUF1492 domain-containing protein [Streptococcus rifensis]
METKQIKANAIRKLKEFWSWRNISNSEFEYDENYNLYVTRSYPLDQCPKVWQRESPSEFKAIVEGINAIDNPRYRAILILQFAEIYLNNKDIMDRLNLKSSQYYNLKNKALLEFAKHYRSGWLETYRG